MREYIDREVARRIIDSPRSKEQMLTMLASIPAAEVKEITYAHLVPIDDYPHEEYECDKCGHVIDILKSSYNYCDCCGAEFLGKEKDGKSDV